MQTTNGDAIPVEIRYGGPEGSRSLDLNDPRWPELASALEQVLDDMEAQARTLFDAERYATEVETVPHVWVDYGQPYDFTGRNVNWRAQELTLAVINDEPMLLARGTDQEDWSVYLPGDRQRIPDWVETVESLSAQE